MVDEILERASDLDFNLHCSQCLPYPNFSVRSWSWRRSRGMRWGFICASPATGFHPRSANVFISTFIVSNSDYGSNRRSTTYRVPRVEAKSCRGWKCNNIFRFRFTVPPVIHVPNQLVGAPLGTDVVLECFVEASPMSINYWVKDPKGEMTREMIHEMTSSLKIELSRCVSYQVAVLLWIALYVIPRHFSVIFYLAIVFLQSITLANLISGSITRWLYSLLCIVYWEFS